MIIDKVGNISLFLDLGMQILDYAEGWHLGQPELMYLEEVERSGHAQRGIRFGISSECLL